MTRTDSPVSSLLFADVHRLAGRASWPLIIRHVVTRDTFRYIVAMRVSANARWRPVRWATRLYLRSLGRKLGIGIPSGTVIGPGFFIGHRGGIVVNSAAKIGADCNISHNVTIGVTRGPRGGVPIIGDRVYVGPGAVVIGPVTVGDDVAIGANAVVTKDVPSGFTAVGNPAQSRPGGSGEYINQTSR